MHMRSLACLAFFLHAFAAGTAAGETWRDEEGFVAAARIRRGVNLGNAWEAPPGTWGEQRYTARDFRAIREAGFDHVRIPVAWHHYQREEEGLSVGGILLREIDAMIAGARAEGLAIVLTWHHFDDLTSKPEEPLLSRWRAGWRSIARHYLAVPPENLLYELLNEPRDAATSEVMNTVYPGVIAAIREVDPRRTLIVSPGNWGALAKVPELSISREWTNVIATGHCYDPFLFTHQGSSWNGNTTRTLGIVFPGPPAEPVKPGEGVPDWVVRWVADHSTRETAGNPSGPEAFLGQIRAAAEWSRREGRAVYVGEFGAIVHADAPSRVRFARAFREAVESEGLGWAWWDWKANFALVRETPQALVTDTALIEALTGLAR